MAVCRYGIGTRASALNSFQVTSESALKLCGSSDGFGVDNENSKLTDRIGPPLSPTQRAGGSLEMMENKGGSEISEIRVQPGSRSHGFTLSPTMAAWSYMQENTFNMGDGRVKG